MHFFKRAYLKIEGTKFKSDSIDDALIDDVLNNEKIDVTYFLNSNNSETPRDYQNIDLQGTQLN